MAKEEYIKIKIGTDEVLIPTDLNKRNAYQRGIVKGWNALVEHLNTIGLKGITEEAEGAELKIDEGGKQ